MNLIDLLVKAFGKRPLGRRLLSLGVTAYDRWLCSPTAVAEQASRDVAPRSGFTFSVGIAHHNRGAVIARSLRNLLNHPSVSEVVIVDDGSSVSEFEALRQQVRLIDKTGRVKIHRRDENRGALLTKLECVEKCSTDWVLILDSDNTAFTDYLDHLEALAPSDPKIIYCADWAYPYFPFHELSGMTLDFGKSSKLLISRVLKRNYLLNDGNYLVNRNRYLKVISTIGKIPSDVVDVLVVNYLWLSQGGKLDVIPGAKYMHRVDELSFWSQTAEASKKRLLAIYERIESAVPWDEDFLRRLINGRV